MKFIDFLSEKYGDWILYKPKFNYENFLLWVFPYLVLVIGGLIISFLIKKRQKKHKLLTVHISYLVVFFQK